MEHITNIFLKSNALVIYVAEFHAYKVGESEIQ